jgi:hypothetical protein
VDVDVVVVVTPRAAHRGVMTMRMA